MNVTMVKSLCNARPHPGPLPRGEGETLSVSFANPRLDSRGVITSYRQRSQDVPSPGGEGQGEGGRFTIHSEPPDVGCYESL
jgi:hypothetical protein